MTDYTVGDTLHIAFSTRAFATGIPTVLAGTPVVAAYEDAGLTQITAGITLGIDHDGVVGFNMLTIVATGGNGFESGKDYNLVVTTGTVGGVSVVGEVVGRFTFGRSAAAVDLANGTDGLGAIKADIATAQADLDTITDADGVILGAAGVDLVWDEVLTGATHNVSSSSGRRLRSLQDFGLYEGGAVWIDTINGTAGTTDFENGTVTNPVDNLADARTLATSLGLTAFHIGNGSSITLASNSDNLTFMGENWTIAFGGQSVANASISGAIDVSGVSSGNDLRLQRCHIKTCTIGNVWASDCRLGGTVTMISTGGHFFQSCYATTGTVPIIDLGAVGAQTLCLTPLTGGIQINNTAAGDLVHIEGQGEILLDASCNGGTLEYAGDFRLTDNATAITINPDDNTVNLAAVLVDTGTTLDAAIAVIDTNIDEIEMAVITNAAGVDIAADIAAIEAQTDDIGVAGAGLSAIPWNAAWDAEVESEVNDALDTVISELGVAAPAATPTIRTALMLMYMALRNQTIVQTSGTDALEIYNNAGTLIAQKLLTDAAGDYTEAEMTSG